MAFATTDFEISPSDGWVEVASNYATLQIRPAEFLPWWLAVTDGTAPAADLVGMSFGRGGDNARETYESPAANAGKAFIRVREPGASYPNVKTRFCAITS